MRKIKAGKLGGPRVKWNETVFCTHCADTGKDRKTAECVSVDVGVAWRQQPEL